MVNHVVIQWLIKPNSAVDPMDPSLRGPRWPRCPRQRISIRGFTSMVQGVRTLSRRVVMGSRPSSQRFWAAWKRHVAKDAKGNAQKSWFWFSLILHDVSLFAMIYPDSLLLLWCSMMRCYLEWSSHFCCGICWNSVPGEGYEVCTAHRDPRTKREEFVDGRLVGDTCIFHLSQSCCTEIWLCTYDNLYIIYYMELSDTTCIITKVSIMSCNII